MYNVMGKHPERHIPRWAEQERGNDMTWIKENLHVFWPAARTGYEAVGRGALRVDLTQTFSHPGGISHPFGYLDQGSVDQLGDEDMKRMVKEYDPSWEMVTALFKPNDRISTYRIGVIQSGPRENLGNRGD